MSAVGAHGSRPTRDSAGCHIGMPCALHLARRPAVGKIAQRLRSRASVCVCVGECESV